MPQSLLRQAGARRARLAHLFPAANGFVCACQTAVCALGWFDYVHAAGDLIVRRALNIGKNESSLFQE